MSQIIFFNKNYIDISRSAVNITITDGVAINDGDTLKNNLRNRNNSSYWLTTGSDDSANTLIEFDLGDFFDITDLIFINHNFKSYNARYWDGLSYVEFPAIVDQTTNTRETTHHVVPATTTSKIRLEIRGTMVADDDKKMSQVYICSRLGQLDAYPQIKNPTHSTNKFISKMLSGKSNVINSLGAFNCSLEVESWKSDADLSLVESLYFARQGYHLWLCGGDEDQFSSKRVGYRLQDLYFVKTVNDYQPEWWRHYKTGLRLRIDLAEVV